MLEIRLNENNMPVAGWVCPDCGDFVHLYDVATIAHVDGEDFERNRVVSVQQQGKTLARDETDQGM